MHTEIEEKDTKKFPGKARKAADKARETVKGGLKKMGHAVGTAALEVRDAFDRLPASDAVRPAPTTVDLGPDGTPPSPPELYGATECGKVRENNEDQFLVAELVRSMRVHQSSATPTLRAGWARRPQGWILMVADGVGGHAAGEMASEVAINTMANYAFSLMPWSFAQPGADAPALAEGFKRAVERCQQNVEQKAKAEDIGAAPLPPGTTLTAAYVAWPNLYIAHVGDSRCYVYREGKLHAMTHDHTYAAQTPIDGTELGDSVLSNVLLNAVGGGSREVRAELRHVALRPKDIVLLCTDGVTQYLNDDELAIHLNLLSKDVTPGVRACTEGLLKSANDRGGEDNLTVVIGRF